jgi:hypothetical protein
MKISNSIKIQYQLIPLLLVVFFTSCGASTKLTKVNIEPVSKIINIDNSKSQLYIKANDWMVNSFNNSKSVIQFSDKENGIVTGKYLMKSIFLTDGWSGSNKEIYAIIKIQNKDGASKITISPAEYEYYTGFGQQDIHRFTQQDAQNQINDLLSSFEEFMTRAIDDF